MHETFYFDLPEGPRYTRTQLLSPMKSVSTALAGVALRSFIMISANSRDIFSGLAKGRVHLPLPLILSHNNIHAGKIGTPLPVQVISLGDAAFEKSRRIWLILFTDRSALIAREETDCGEDLNAPLMRILPVVLKLASRARMRHRNAEYSLSVSADTDKEAASLLVDPGTRSSPFPFLAGPYPTHPVLEDMSVLQAQFKDEISDWAEEVDRAPLVHLPESYEAAGTFPQDHQDPEMAGRIWGWPAVMEHIGFSDEQFKSAQKFCHLAFQHLLMRHGDRMRELAVRVQTGQINQDAKAPKINIEIIAHEAGVLPKKTESLLRTEYRALLQHEKAPAFLFDMKGQTVVESDTGGALSRILPWTLYLGTKTSPGSRHDQLAAHAVFGH